jgi:hypothetical protein
MATLNARAAAPDDDGTTAAGGDVVGAAVVGAAVGAGVPPLGAAEVVEPLPPLVLDGLGTPAGDDGLLVDPPTPPAAAWLTA